MTQSRRTFIDGKYGQLHVRVAAPEDSQKRSLACLYMSPKSGKMFANFMEFCSSDRVFVAHDYPGFGESDPPPPEPHVTIGGYARSLWEVVDALQLGTIDILGYRTDSEVAAKRPGQVGGIVMVPAPVLTSEEIVQMHEVFKEIPMDIAGTRFKYMWDNVVTHRGLGASLETMAASFAENLRAGKNYEWGHRAAFACAPQFLEVAASLPHSISVLRPADELADVTQRIESYLSNGKIIDHPEWGHGFLDVHALDAADAVRAALDG